MARTSIQQRRLEFILSVELSQERFDQARAISEKRIKCGFRTQEALNMLLKEMSLLGIPDGSVHNKWTARQLVNDVYSVYPHVLALRQKQLREGQRVNLKGRPGTISKLSPRVGRMTVRFDDGTLQVLTSAQEVEKLS